MARILWTQDEIATLLRMKANKTRLRVIAAALGKSESAVESQLRYQRLTSEERFQRRIENGKFRRKRGIMPRNSHGYAIDTRVTPPDDVWVERNIRINAPRSIGAILLGDPAPGYSALDRRGA